jgi:16S rRNA (adenine1518-N6/adenine1519-N6)-dimethyltransferase
VEIDPLLARQLPKTIAEHSHSEINRLTVLNRDILTLPRSELVDEPTALVANLPYNVAVPALLHLLAEFPSIRTVMVMVQAEVAERLAAEPGGKDYGVPSVKVRFFGNVRRYGMVSPTVFWPIPRVYSGLVRIDRHDTSPWPTDPEFRAKVFELIDVAFAQRRKTSRNAFAVWAGSGNESARRLLAASIDPSRRGETLSVADFIRLLQRSGEWEQGAKEPQSKEPQSKEPQSKEPQEPSVRVT